MATRVELETDGGLEIYERVASLRAPLQELRDEAAALVPALRGRRVWMVNSTPRGGGVAEMLPKQLGLLRELGVDCDWWVIDSDRREFFDLTKRIHNMIHGVGEPGLGPDDRALLEQVALENLAELQKRVASEDVLVVHDPQPIVLGHLLREALGVRTVWRCHVGLPDRTPVTRDVWKFLRPWASAYDHAIFSAPEYVPSYLAGDASIIHPAIDPLGDKSRELPIHVITGVLCNAGLAVESQPVVMPPFAHPARRLLPDASWRAPCEFDEIGLAARPAVLQISRWDRLKGWEPLIDAFVHLKRRHRGHLPELHQRRLELLRLVLAGPDPASVADDPEGRGVLEDLSQRYLALPPDLQRDVALLTLPMDSRRENALMVNALQRCATVVVQNSTREGFGLTVTEALWKRNAVLGSQACGIRQQIRHQIDGWLAPDATDPEGVCDALDTLLRDRPLRARLRDAAQRRVYTEFLIFTQLRKWLRVLAETVTR